jgi:hypothetical protein
MQYHNKKSLKFYTKPVEVLLMHKVSLAGFCVLNYSYFYCKQNCKQIFQIFSNFPLFLIFTSKIKKIPERLILLHFSGFHIELARGFEPLTC